MTSSPLRTVCAVALMSVSRIAPRRQLRPAEVGVVERLLVGTESATMTRAPVRVGAA